MRPLLLHLENFGSFREPTTVDFTDADYFALVGPTGAGKSTVIDAICFALYGTVPRWGRENVVSYALAPSATTGRVGLVFESGGRRYAAVRVLARSARGTVNTKEARLDELDPSAGVEAGADPGEVMRAVVRSLAEGPEPVTEEVQRITGLEYQYFTQCVVLPQGQFQEFLHARPSKRQELLVQLLDAGVYERIRQRAVHEEELAKQAAAMANAELARLAGADEAAERDAEERLAALRALAGEVRTRVAALREAEQVVRDASQDVQAARQRLEALDRLALPAEVPRLAGEIRAADREIAASAERSAASEAEERTAEERLAELGDKTVLARALDAHRDRERLTAELSDQRTRARDATDRAAAAAADLDRALADLAAAEGHHERVRVAHAGADLAGRLVPGEACPVCLRPVHEVPEHPVPADLGRAAEEAERRRAGAERVREAQQAAEVAAEGLRQRSAATAARLGELAGSLRAYPDRADLERRLASVESAEREAAAARSAARSHRLAHQDAQRRAARLREAAEQGWRDLDEARDGLVTLGAPPPERDDLHNAWERLLAWRDEAVTTHRREFGALTERLAEAERVRDGERSALLGMVQRAGVTVRADALPDEIADATAAEAAHAEARLERVRENRARSAELAARAAEAEEQARVAHRLGLLLKANNFEKWLCSEALELLLAAGSQTLRDLTGGTYELTLSGKGDIEVVDYGEAGMQRSVRTLSGGETFQAALALALALSSQVAGMAAAAARSLDSIFLDEGFGTLDPAALDTVAGTLERLAADGDRMVGIVTHVPALAERVPVRFEVTRDDRGSHLRKVGGGW